MITKVLKTTFLATALAAFLLPAAAQTANDNSTTPPSNTTPSSVNGGGTGNNQESVSQRKGDQQDRIGQGMDNGSLTPGEAKRLENREANINKETREMRAADGGKLTAADKAKLEKKQNNLSQAIHRQKHDSQTMTAAQDPQTHVGERKDNQQQRISEGVQSGRLSPQEAAKLEKQQKHIRAETANMREENGGKLTTADKAKLQRQQNRASRSIHAEKHDKK